MTTKLFFVFAVLMLAAVGAATYQDAQARDYLAIQTQYTKEHPGSQVNLQIEQLFPAFGAAKIGDTFRVERCISCHVPDITQIGPEKAAQNLAADFFKHAPDAQAIATANHLTGVHPAYICAGTAAAAPQSSSAAAAGTPTPSSSAQPTAAASPAVAAHPVATGGCGAAANSVSLAQYGPSGVLSFNVGGETVTEPGYLPGSVLTDPTGAQLTKLGIDQVGCIICHNGSRLALTASDAAGASDRGAHENLIINPTYVWTAGAELYYKNCVVCHGAQGVGGTGPPLSNQDRLGFFNEDYYYRCIEYGMTGFEHVGSIMPNWGSVAPDYSGSAKPVYSHRQLTEDQINILVQYIRHWQKYDTLP